MSDKSANNKRIAKNTLLLYLRSFIVMIVTLYTSRVILHALGIEDYGLYNVVGGVVALFSFLRTSLTKSTQRFLNVAMARQEGRLKDTFRVSLTIHVIIAVVAILLAETIGLWFLNNYIQIPEGREFAANIVYQTTIISLVLTILSVPYNASIIAHEKMGYFAVVSIVDCVLKLAICYAIMQDSIDRLILYAWLMMGVTLVNALMYALYCFKKCPECGIGLKYDKQMFKEMLSYTTWTVVGQIAIVGTNQGNNILVNMFYSVTANAAMGVATQVNAAIVTLASNFQTAFNPQITKSYAVRDFDYLKFLVYCTSKISYFMLFLVSLPIMFNIDAILGIWLKEVPLYANIFCILVLCNSILNALSTPLNFSVLSSGKIKWFQIVTSLVYLSDVIIVYLLFSMGCPPYTALAVKVSIMVAILFVRLYFSNREVECINLRTFAKDVLIPIIGATLLCVSTGFILFRMGNSISQRVIASFILVAFSLAIIYLIGLSEKERQQLFKLVKKVKK